MMYVITVIKNCSFLALASASLDDLLPCQGDSQGAGGEIYVEKNLRSPLAKSQQGTEPPSSKRLQLTESCQQPYK